MDHVHGRFATLQPNTNAKAETKKANQHANENLKNAESSS